MAEMNDHTSRLIIDVVRLLAAGKISAANALPTLRALTARDDDPISFDSLIEAIREDGGPDAERLIADLTSCRLRDAAKLNAQRRQGVVRQDGFRLTLTGIPHDAPLEWTSPGDAINPLADAMRVARDRRFIARAGDAVPVANELLRQRYLSVISACSEELRRLSSVLVEVFQESVAGEATDGPNDATWQQLQNLAKSKAQQFSRKLVAENIAAKLPQL